MLHRGTSIATYIKLLSLTLFSMQEIKYTYSTEAIRVDKTIIYGNRISMLAFDVKNLCMFFMPINSNAFLVTWLFWYLYESLNHKNIWGFDRKFSINSALRSEISTSIQAESCVRICIQSKTILLFHFSTFYQIIF